MSTPANSVELLLANWVLDRLAPENIPALAVQALQDGCESQAVATLAGLLRPTRADVEAELPRLLRDLGRQRPTGLQALKMLVDARAAAIVAGTEAPITGAGEIAALWACGFDDVRHATAWLDLRSFMELAQENDSDDVHGDADAIVEEARRLLSRGGVNISGRVGAGQLDGRIVADCRVQEHILDDVRAAVRLGLELQDGLFVTFGSTFDGQSLQLGFKPLAAYDLAEYGRVEVRREGFPCDVLAPGTTVAGVMPLVDDNDLTVGVRIDSGAESIYVYVRADWLAIERQPPSDLAGRDHRTI